MKKRKFKKRLKKYAYDSIILGIDREQFILDYDACGIDEKLHNNIKLFEKLIIKYFTITHTEILPGMIIYHYI